MSVRIFLGPKRIPLDREHDHDLAADDGDDDDDDYNHDDINKTKDFMDKQFLILCFILIRVKSNLISRTLA